MVFHQSWLGVRFFCGKAGSGWNEDWFWREEWEALYQAEKPNMELLQTDADWRQLIVGTVPLFRGRTNTNILP